MTDIAPGSLVTTRGRDWVVLPESETDMLVLRPLGGSDDDIAAIFPELEGVEPASFPPPDLDDLGDAASASLLRTAMQVGFRSSAGPFRSLAQIAVEPRAYQLVPLLMALRQQTTRLLIGDDVGIGKTIEAGLIAAELLASGEAKGLAVLCSPALAEQWQDELRLKFGIDAELVLASTVAKLERGLESGESLFDRYPNIVVSTDFIKSPRHRDLFIRHCPDLVIVDEAHTCVATDDRTGKGQQLRYELLQRLAADTDRHLVLLTATPHSGKATGFRNLLGLLDPSLENVDLKTDAGRRRLARYFVQRRRVDIRRYLDQDTSFPSDREFREQTYQLTPAYRALLDDALAYARGRLTASSGLEHRKAWWSALAMLRSIVSSPRAAAQTCASRSRTAQAATIDEADALGRPISYDFTDADRIEGVDVSPGAVDDDQAAVLESLRKQAEALEGPEHDAKLKALTKQLKSLLKDGYNPIVFCKYIGTADYVAEQLTDSLGKKVHVKSVTGTISPQQRVDRIEAFAALAAEDSDARRVLVATDCLSEGVNLQHHFDAVVHYDLAWNPTRHDQREGRVDRFGQTTDRVKVVTVYGKDNGVDGKVLEVLIKKHRQIYETLGYRVSVPDETSSAVTNAVVEWVLMRGSGPGQEQPLLDGILEIETEVEQAWQSAAEREKSARTRYAQEPIRTDEVANELAAVRDALGAADDIAPFTRRALHSLRALITETGDGFRADVSTTPVGLRDALAAALGGEAVDGGKPITFRTQPAVARGEAALVRTDPAVAATADFILNGALDDTIDPSDRPARRLGVMRTADVAKRTTLLLARFRFQLRMPGRHGTRHLVAEDARLLAFEGSPTNPTWLDDQVTAALLSAAPAANTAPEFARNAAKLILDGLPELDDHLDATADRLAERLAESHQRVRAETGRRESATLAVTPQRPADLLGVYVYLPVPTGAA
ncbi:DEAD/DEAH box helicase [Glycomyces arizonensis]|uniref:DEAD/DEAH box helicase n=1 Tax=Glycomyces arizonensis TaxID=256035 RepID=UPI00042932BD|nr:DEAD/DEAH box helicase [Glycomyces arizonensis]